jgi:hypothetical protein
MAAMEKTATVYQRAVQGVMTELHNTSAKVDTIIGDIGSIKSSQDETMNFIRMSFENLVQNPSFSSFMDDTTQGKGKNG